MSKFHLFSSFALFALFCISTAEMNGISGGNSILLILQDKSMENSYSLFLNDLKQQGFELSIVTVSDKKVSLMRYGEYIYHHIIILAPNTPNPVGLSEKEILKVLDDGVNVIVALDSNSPPMYRKLCQEVGVEMNAHDSVVIDHFHYYKPGQDHTQILTDRYSKNPIILNSLKGEIRFHGIGMKASTDNYLIVPILSGGQTSYSGKVGDVVKTTPQTSGSNTILVASIQARNNARLTISGSIELLSNKNFEIATLANREFMKRLSSWTFHKVGVLKMTDITHHKIDGSLPETQLHRPPKTNLPETMYPEPEVAPDSLVYRIKDEIVYSTIIQEFKYDKWVPYQADDVQLEFVMLNPYLRHNLVHDKKGNFSTVFTAPDVYGIYKFHLMYRREGYTVLESDTQVSLRPFRHNEYERFIVTAYPYYVSVFTMIVGFFVFGFVYLYN